MYFSLSFTSCSVLTLVLLFFLMIRRPPRSTLSSSSAASDVYKRQRYNGALRGTRVPHTRAVELHHPINNNNNTNNNNNHPNNNNNNNNDNPNYYRYYYYPVSYTHLRAHETVLDLVCRLLLEKKKQKNKTNKI
eukprot:TRINITY_DN4978_c0_g1_i3.p1 TRINITY_DN4978_c0_g1~~TRINITY_DN4978_c0_g1_i3.p1  ORF type:complete len:134 (+),score=27.14 TRINITY_DN4978_c0_g1_i3:39-440(+)